MGWGGNVHPPSPIYTTHTFEYNTHAVARLELVQADAATYVEGALSLLPYAEEGFQVIH